MKRLGLGLERSVLFTSLIDTCCSTYDRVGADASVALPVILMLYVILLLI